jgi:acetate CoA/acetoacetate CoA-transferase alpha subunit
MRTMTAEEAVARIPDGASLMIGGFMGVGSPAQVIDELHAPSTAPSPSA